MPNDVIDGELIEDSNGKWLWRMADGRHIAVENMADNHLRNAAMFLMGMGYQKCTANDIARVVWLAVFRKEWERRMFLRAEEKRRNESNIEYNNQKELEDGVVYNGTKQLR